MIDNCLLYQRSLLRAPYCMFGSYGCSVICEFIQRPHYTLYFDDNNNFYEYSIQCKEFYINTSMKLNTTIIHFKSEQQYMLNTYIPLPSDLDIYYDKIKTLIMFS